MTSDNIRRQMGLSDGPGGNAADDDGGLPWLEPAPDPDRGTFSFKSLAIIGTIFLLVFIALVAIFYNRIAGTNSPAGAGGSGLPTLIAAPPGPFKITPEEAAEGFSASQTDYARNDVSDIAGTRRLEEAIRDEGGVAVDLSRGDDDMVGFARPIETPEVAEKTPPLREAVPPQVREPKPTPPVATRQPEKKPAPKKPDPVPTPPAQTASASASGGYLLQLGAFSSRDSALNGWEQFSGKYRGSLAGLSPDIESFQNSGGRTLYRLRAAGLETRGAADSRCAALKAADQPCFVVER